MIHKKFEGATIYKPGIYWNCKVDMIHGIPIAQKIDLNNADCVRVKDFLDVLVRLDLIWSVSHSHYKKANDNELYYKILIWKEIND